MSDATTVEIPAERMSKIQCKDPTFRAGYRSGYRAAVERVIRIYEQEGAKLNPRRARELFGRVLLDELERVG